MARLILSSCLGLVLLGSVTAIAEPSPGSDLSGVYACEGTNPDGSPYTAVVEIVKRQDTYLVRWTQENDEQVMGVGIQQDGVLAVSYFGGAPAIVVYSLATEGRLTGQWTMGGAGRLFKETLTKVSAIEVDIQAGQAGQTGQTGLPAGVVAGLHQHLVHVRAAFRRLRPQPPEVGPTTATTPRCSPLSARLCAKLRADSSSPTRSMRSSASHSSAVSPWRSASLTRARPETARATARRYRAGRETSRIQVSSDT